MDRKPPKSLPRGYHDLWRAVDAEDRSAGSRAEAARRLGVSTHTLQRILVDGNVPDFRRPQSRRLVLSWVRTLANLAVRFEREPRDWIESAGIPWDDQVRIAAEGVSRRVRGVAARAIPVAVDPLVAIRGNVRRGDSAPVRAALVVRPLLGEALPDRPISFLQACAERLVGAVDPRWGVQWETGSPARIAEALAEARSGLHLAVGLFETAQLRGRGLEFLTLPGWRVGFRALWIGAAGSRPPRWEDLTGPGRSRDGYRFMVRDADPGWWIVRRQWEVPAPAILVRDRADVEALAAELFEEARRCEAPGVVLVADAPTVARVAALVVTRDGFRPDWQADELRAAEGQEPRYPLALAMRADGPEWLRVLAHAWKDEVLGAAPHDLARLYAEVVAVGTRPLLASPALAPGADRSGGVAFPEHFEGALPVFVPAFWNALLPRIAANARGADDVATAWDRAQRLAYSLSPPQWRPSLEAEVYALGRKAMREAGEEPRPFHSFCQSCSASLLESPGPADCYCCYCADERGNLRSRDEVQRGIAQWMRMWQAGLEEGESMERAARFMSVMPAWTLDRPGGASSR